MKEHFVDLTDGTRLGIKVNFGTLYYLQKMKGFYRLAKMKKEEMSNTQAMDLTANVIYAILRSNGRAVTFDEALQLVPPDTDQIEEALSGFQEQMEKYNKKKEAKAAMRKMGR